MKLEELLFESRAVAKAAAYDAIAAPVAAVLPDPVAKEIEPVKQEKKTIEKNNISKAAAILGPEAIEGAKDENQNKKINLEDVGRRIYTPSIVMKRGLQRAAMGATIGAGVSAYNNESALHGAEVGALAGGIAGATYYPLAVYGMGRLAQKVHNIKKDKK